MTFLEKMLKERGITVYKVCNVLGKNAAGSSNYFKQQIKGETPMAYDDYKKLLEFLTLTESPDHYDLVKVRIK